MKDKPQYNPYIHHRRSIRLKGFDYSQEGFYFITICCENRKHRFGEIENGEMILNECGQIAYNEWVKLSERFPNFELDVFQIMPNHIHGIIALVLGQPLRLPQMMWMMRLPQMMWMIRLPRMMWMIRLPQMMWMIRLPQMMWMMRLPQMMWMMRLPQMMWIPTMIRLPRMTWIPTMIRLPQIIRILGQPQGLPPRLPQQLPQQCLTWSGHTNRWWQMVVWIFINQKIKRWVNCGNAITTNTLFAMNNPI